MIRKKAKNNYEFALQWARESRAAAKRGIKLSWTKWLERAQRDCGHDFVPMIQPLNDAVVGAKCRICGKVY